MIFIHYVFRNYYYQLCCYAFVTHPVWPRASGLHTSSSIRAVLRSNTTRCLFDFVYVYFSSTRSVFEKHYYYPILIISLFVHTCILYYEKNIKLCFGGCRCCSGCDCGGGDGSLEKVYCLLFYLRF